MRTQLGKRNKNPVAHPQNKWECYIKLLLGVHTGEHRQAPKTLAKQKMHVLQKPTSGCTNFETSYTPPPSRSHCAVKYSTFCSGLGGRDVSLTSPIWLAHFRVYGGPSVCCACCAAVSSPPDVEASCAAVCIISKGCVEVSCTSVILASMVNTVQILQCTCT